MRKLRLISKILLSLLLGLVLALAWFQFDERFIALTNNGMKKIFEHQLNCCFKGRVKRVNPFLLKVDFEDVQVQPFDAKKDWSWAASQMTMRLSFLEYLYYGAFGLHVKLIKLRSFSGFKDSGIPVVGEHLLNLFAGTNFNVPIAFQTVAIIDGKLMASDPLKKTRFICCWNSNAGKSGKDFKAKFYVSQASLMVDKKKLFEQFKGQITFDAICSNKFVRIATDAMVALPQLPQGQQDCYVMGSWDKNMGSFVLYNQDRTFSFVPIDIALHNNALMVNVEGVVLLDYLKQLWLPHITQTINGMCCVKFTGDLFGSLQAKLRIQDVGYKQYLLDELYGDVMRIGKVWRGTIGGREKNSKVTGVWQWFESEQQGIVQLMNRTALPFLSSMYWEAVPGKTTVQVRFKNDGTGHLEYATECAHKKTEHTITSSGKMTHMHNEIIGKGVIGDNAYEALIATKPLCLKSFVYKDNEQKDLVALETEQHNTFSLTVDYRGLQILADDWLGLNLSGHGTFKVTAYINYPTIVGTLSFKNGAIRPVSMYNFISDITTRFVADSQKRECTLKDTSLILHQGKIVSDKISCFFNDDGSLYGLHSPLRFENCFLNWNKYLYAVCTGSAVLQLGSGIENSMDGFLVLERSQFKENIFALKTQQSALKALPTENAFGSVRLNFGVSTQTPLLVTTPHLQTQALLDCLITGSLRAPQFNGCLQLRGGKLVFPAKTLTISQGKLTFLPTQSDDCSIELTAQAQIKKYLITLTIGGTIKDPEVFLQASPGLSEEQIIMLLLTGSEQESFNIMVPSLVMRNVETILFGSSNALAQAPTSFSSWLKPLEKVTFVPRFNDQTGRGGFKGVLEVEVSKRLRAALEKDFSLAEDASAEIEYLASDDVSFKINRDERGDIGAEVEMRFKF